jgi:hypothetical protein
MTFLSRPTGNPINVPSTSSLGLGPVLPLGAWAVIAPLSIIVLSEAGMLSFILYLLDERQIGLKMGDLGSDT